MVGMVAGWFEGMDKEGSEPNASSHDTSWGVGGGLKNLIAPVADRAAETNAVRVKNEKSSRVNFRMLKLHRQ